MPQAAIVGDTSSHGGLIVSSNQDGRLKAGGVQICANGCLHSCPIPFHGTTPVTAITLKSYVNGKLIVTTGAVAGCGAVIIGSALRTYVE